MNDLYSFLEITKQAHIQHIKRQKRMQENKDILLRNMLELRQFHPEMGAKKMYEVLCPVFLGRDAFINFYSENNFSLKRKPNYQRTTFSSPSARYHNLTINKTFNDINQLWTSDITYFEIGFKVYLYLTFIIDVYSRRILGYNVSEDLSAKSTIKALEMALKKRNIRSYHNSLIHHSDKGVQYTSNIYTNLLSKYDINISMCNSVYENSHIERVNGIIKNEYLVHYPIKSVTECQRTLPKVIDLYNEVRPHWSLSGLTPVAYEKTLKEIKLSERILLEIFHDKDKYNCQYDNQLSLTFNG